MAANLTVVRDANVTEGMTDVRLYTVVWSGFLVLVLIVLGTLPNCALLVATRCKRQLQRWNSALIYNVCVCSAAFCLLWIPLNFGVLVTNYYGGGVHVAACYVHVALFHFCAAELTTCTLLLGVQRVYGVWSRRPHQSSNVLVGGAVVFTWFSGCLCATYVSFGYSRTYGFASCVHRPVSAVGVGVGHSAETVLCLVHMGALLSTVLVFLSLALSRRRRAGGQQSRVDRKRNCNYHGIPSSECAGVADDDRVNTSVCSQTSPTKSSLRDSSDVKKSSGTLSISKKVCLQEPTADDIHNIESGAGQEDGGGGGQDDDDDDDDDDDKFDLKMRLRLSKCKRSSGRRHTVANIGTAEANFRGRRGSMDNQRGSGSQLNYQYIRKWSVDIVALQEQLENPKLHPVPLEELVSFRDRARGSEATGKAKAEPKRDETVATRVKDVELRMIKEQLSEEGEAAAGAGEQDADRTPNDAKPAARNQTENNCSRTDDNEVIVSVCGDPSSSSIEVPAVTVRSERPAAAPADSDHDQRTAGPDQGQQKAKVKQQLACLWRSVLHALLVVVCLLPLCVFSFVADESASTRNVLMTLALLQCPFHPLVIAWADPVVRQAVRRLKLKMMSLRCVCYCNIGKGKRCLGRPPEYR